uniref:Ubiquinone/menaquinone biosynthesis C-methyltransferase UbiE n=1 Tax=Candidatus Aschnera chinzeii TaxID=1485666 RepID=A0AAT9G508_9ENTR|nr:MAG: bifunctional demethylmenaquinone methyltransferase/2-methoxy-6-polyprenyl-1,4-benzoquinol methylase UbiE [Candidatus Aschnera chinzeii]
MPFSDHEKTDFGFHKIYKVEKNKLIYTIFHSVSKKYDIMNDIASFGLHRIWKYLTVKVSNICYGEHVLDIAGGTGDLTIQLAKKVGKSGKVILADINDAMLHIGRKKIRNLGIINNVSYLLTNAEELPFIDNYFDCIHISFGLRNITDKNIALKSMYRVLKPGGRLIILEFSKPYSLLLSKCYDIYSFYFLPYIGKLITNDFDSYRYLVESIRMHPDQKQLKNIIESNGFQEVSYTNISGGIVAIHKAYKF